MSTGTVQDVKKMAYRSSYVFRVVLHSDTIRSVQATFPCIDFSSSETLSFINDHKEVRLLDALQTKVSTEIVRTAPDTTELRICSNFAATYEVIDRIEFLIEQISEEHFGFILIGERLDDNIRKGNLEVGYVVRSIYLPTGWTPSQVFDRDDY